MLASPLYAAPAPFASQSDEGAKYSRDIESFNKLLPPPVEFVEGSSSGALAVPEGKYEPINATPKPGKTERPRNASPPPSPTKASGPGPKSAPLHNGAIDTAWPLSSNVASGLYNSGNTCFLNSALQCLFHTPPLLSMLIEHTESKCRVKPGIFCMACNLRKVATQAHGSRTAFVPSAVSGKLQVIAKHMRKGRQEDSHEFLRYAIDALQKSCLAGQPPKIDPLLAETTWVHKIFGGRLRSRVQCGECRYNSDTFDSILDLSLDIHDIGSVKTALRNFVAPFYLNGVDKYKCEKCKKHVNAEKQFTVHEALLVLTVHLKRFTPTGRKITNFVEYEERLSLKPYMSDEQYGPSYSLYGVICHAGGGPNSGHCYAYVKSGSGRWYEMNDESVFSASVSSGETDATSSLYSPVSPQKSAYPSPLSPIAVSPPEPTPPSLTDASPRKSSPLTTAPPASPRKLIAPSSPRRPTRAPPAAPAPAPASPTKLKPPASSSSSKPKTMPKPPPLAPLLLPIPAALARATALPLVAPSGVRVPFGVLLGLGADSVSVSGGGVLTGEEGVEKVGAGAGKTRRAKTRTRRTLVVFLRRFWCPFYQDYMVALARGVRALQGENAGFVPLGEQEDSIPMPTSNSTPIPFSATSTTVIASSGTTPTPPPPSTCAPSPANDCTVPASSSPRPPPPTTFTARDLRPEDPREPEREHPDEEGARCPA